MRTSDHISAGGHISQLIYADMGGEVLEESTRHIAKSIPTALGGGGLPPFSVQIPQQLGRLPPPLVQMRARPLRARRARIGPKGPARGPEGPARASVARPLYLKLLTRHARKPTTRQAKIPNIRQIKGHIYHSIICTENALVQGVTPPSSANVRG